MRAGLSLQHSDSTATSQAHGKATQYKNMHMIAVTLLILLAGIETSMAEVDDCPTLHYRNGTQCVICSKCPRGFGVKENCSAERDTECEPCWPGYDYSDTNSFRRCIICDTYSNCIQGNHKKIKNCTVFSRPVCDGCAEDHFFDPNVGMNGGCVQCSPPCSPLEVQTRPCKTAHDRTCTDKSLATIPISSNLPTVPSKEVPNSTNDDIKVHTEDPALAAATPSAKKLVVWITVGVGSTILVVAFVVTLICRKTNDRRKRGVNARDFTTRGDTQQMTPLMSPQERGLDLPIKDLTIGGRRFIAKKLNGKCYDGYFHWQITADKVGLRDECETWKNHADNPAEKFLTAYGEKEGSTIRNLIKALRDSEVDLTQIAKEIEHKFSPPQVQGEPAKPIDQGEFELAELTYQGQPEDLMAQDEPAAGCVVHTYV